MDGRENVAQERGSSSENGGTGAVRKCKYKPCSVPFKPKRKDHVFHAVSCKTKYTMEAYERGVRQMESRGFHFAKLENSPPLQALHAAFLRRKPGEIVTTLQLSQETKILPVSTRVSELRANGIDISDAIYMGKAETGSRVYGYRLIGRVA